MVRQVEKITEKRERIHYCQKVTVKFTELYCGYNILYHIPHWLNRWPGGGWNDDEIGVTVVIFICGIVVTVAIVAVYLLGSSVKNSPQFITAQDVIILGKVGLRN